MVRLKPKTYIMMLYVTLFSILIILILIDAIRASDQTENTAANCVADCVSLDGDLNFRG